LAEQDSGESFGSRRHSSRHRACWMAYVSAHVLVLVA
jgi:hypothetical protein